MFDVGFKSRTLGFYKDAKVPSCAIVERVFAIHFTYCFNQGGCATGYSYFAKSS